MSDSQESPEKKNSWRYVEEFPMEGVLAPSGEERLILENESTGHKVLLRKIRNTLVGQEVERVERQLQILKLSKHSGLVSIYFWKVEEDKSHYTLMEEFLGVETQTLWTVAMSQELSDNFVYEVALQLIDALHYFQRCGIYAHNLSLENIFLTARNKIKIQILEQLTSVLPPLAEPDDPITPYSSPESIHSWRADWLADSLWRVGVILYVLLFRQFPINWALSREEYFSFILSDRFLFKTGKLQPRLANLLKKLLHLDPQQRKHVF